jgi:hypothetical protein
MSQGTVTSTDKRDTTERDTIVIKNPPSHAKLKSQLLALLLLLSSVGGTLGLFCGVPALARVTFMWQQVILEHPDGLSR